MTGLSIRRVKTGCYTCRRRKVKCDKQWPVCHRCQNTGRACDGYGIWGGGSKSEAATGYDGDTSIQHHSITNNSSKFSALSTFCPVRTIVSASLSKPVQLIHSPPAEQECFEWYIYRSADKLAGVFPSEYWTKLLVQASMTEPAVRYAILAQSAAHREEVLGGGSSHQDISESDDNTGRAVLTISLYNKAIMNLRTSLLDSRPSSRRATLIACALSVSTDFLRGQYASGILHLEGGLRILPTISDQVGGQTSPWEQVDGWIITIFTRLLVQAKLLGQISVSACAGIAILYRLEPKLDKFLSIHHSRRRLEHIMLNAFELQEQALQSAAARKTWPTKRTGVRDTDLSIRRSQLQSALDDWFTTHLATLAHLPSTAPWLERFAHKVMRLYYYNAYIIVGTSLDPFDEMAYDRYESQFHKIMLFCVETWVIMHSDDQHRMQAHHDPESSSPNSVSDIGWIAQLYHTASKCRNHHLRHLALRLLAWSEHKEGIWDSRLAYAAAKEIVDLEEASFYTCAGTSVSTSANRDALEGIAVPSEEDLAWPTLPSDRRLNQVRISLPADSLGKLLLTGQVRALDGTVEYVASEYDVRHGQWSRSQRTI